MLLAHICFMGGRFGEKGQGGKWPMYTDWAKWTRGAQKTWPCFPPVLAFADALFLLDGQAFSKRYGLWPFPWELWPSQLKSGA